MKIDINKTSLLEEIQRPGAWFKKIVGTKGKLKPVKNENRSKLATTLASGFKSLMSTKKLRKSAEQNIKKIQTQYNIRKNSSYDPVYSTDNKKHETYNTENTKRKENVLNSLQSKINAHKNTIEKYRNLEDTKRKLLKTQQYSNSIDIPAKKYAEIQGKKIPTEIDPNTRVTNERVKSFESMPNDQRKNLLKANKEGKFNPMTEKLNSPAVQQAQVEADVYTQREIDNFNKGQNSGLADYKSQNAQEVNQSINKRRNDLKVFGNNDQSLWKTSGLIGGQGQYILHGNNNQIAASRYTA
jgi:hypothetical protein